VGRGADQSYCFLFESIEPTEGGAARLEGAGQAPERVSTSQSSTCACAARASSRAIRQAGRSDLRYAKLSRQRELVGRARADARLLERRGLVDPPLREAVEQRFGELIERLGRA